MAYELIKVSELPELTTPSDPNVLPIQDGDYLKRISFENLKEAATGDVAGDLAAEVTAREGAVSGEATTRANADTAILADLASPYSASATYAVGDYCTKDGVLKRCNTAITTAEAWNSAHWDDAKLGGDVSTLRSALSELESLKNPITGFIENKCVYTGGTVGSTVNINPATLAGYYCIVLDCSAGDRFEINTKGGSSPRAWGFVDANNVLLSVSAYGAVSETTVAPTNAVKIIINDNGGTGTAYKFTPNGRVDVLEAEVSELLKYKQTTKTIYSKAFDTGEYISGQYITPVNGALVTMSGNTGWKTSDFILLEDTDAIVSIPATNIKVNSSECMIAYYATNDYSTFISGVVPNGEPILSRIPEEAKYVIFGSNTSGSGLYTALDADIEIQGVESRSTSAALPSLILPDHYDLIVGDTFELFYKGIIDSFDPDAFYVTGTCSKGACYQKRFILTPTSTGTLTLILKLYNNENKLLDTKSVNLVVRANPSSPAAQKNVLCVGDSLTENGIWVEEFHRRLTANGGTPSGFNMANINFIGTCSRNEVDYEGHGGFTFEKYNTNYISTDTKLITCTHDKGSEDQHSIYADGVGNTWKLETISSDSITIILNSGTASTIPASGSLTWVSGGENHSAITYTSVSNVSGNPFWNTNENKVDFATYATGQGASSIDYVYVLLGWNNWGREMSYIKAQAQTFIDNVQASFPNAKIALIGLEIPSLNGLANNYGTYTAQLSNYIQMVKFVHDVDDAYEELVDDNSNVYHINLTGQFDTEHNMPQSTRPVNVRNAETETYQTNGIHPAQSGSLQIADAVTRHFVGVLG